MQTLALVTAKGGSGKTTLAASMGVAAMQAGERVYLVILDPQGSLLNWESAGRKRTLRWTG